jgi:hypothetical protein
VNALKKVTLTVDDFVETTKLQPEFIKTDVEGAEKAVIAGMQTVLRTLRPIVFVELHSWNGITVSENALSIIKIIREVDYSLIYLRTKAVIEDVSVLSRRGRCHVLLIPAEKLPLKSLDTLDTSAL